jgi:LmbE family N-acetylglucosaminyl deacetylase
MTNSTLESQSPDILSKKRLLLVFAHPDDEQGVGALAARYTAEGADVTLVCATNGDVGTVKPEHLQGYDSITALRRAELDCAAQALGLKEVITLDYRDSGMMGSVDNQHPESLWFASLESVAARLVEIMRRVCPQVIITFDPFGIYGHPDHIKIHQATMAAFQAVQSDQVHPQKVYYMCLPGAKMMRAGLTIYRLLGRDPRRMGTNKDVDAQAVVDAALPAHARIYIRPYLESALRAMACHASQIDARATSPVVRFLWKLFGGYTRLTRAAPEPRPGERMETDVFLGVA